MEKKTANGLEIVQVGPRETLRLSPEDAEKLRKAQGTSTSSKKAPVTSATIGRTKVTRPSPAKNA